MYAFGFDSPILNLFSYPQRGCKKNLRFFTAPYQRFSENKKPYKNNGFFGGSRIDFSNKPDCFPKFKTAFRRNCDIIAKRQKKLLTNQLAYANIWVWLARANQFLSCMVSEC